MLQYNAELLRFHVQAESVPNLIPRHMWTAAAEPEDSLPFCRLAALECSET